jgi:hypothetical protein
MQHCPSSPNSGKQIIFTRVRNEEGNMHVPTTGEHVYVDELSGIFVVAWVDDETQTVDLIPSTGTAPRKEYVPWQKLFRCCALPIQRVNRVNATPGLMQ